MSMIKYLRGETGLAFNRRKGKIDIMEEIKKEIEKERIEKEIEKERIKKTILNHNDPNLILNKRMCYHCFNLEAYKDIVKYKKKIFCKVCAKKMGII